jgi:uncharacterized membrane protein YvbJ
MVYCHECGTKNDDDAEYCSKCGAALKDRDDRDERYRRRRERRHRHRDDSFGLPNGGIIVGLLFGVLLIMVGVSTFYGVSLWRYLWPIIIVILGILIVAGAISNYARRR